MHSCSLASFRFWQTLEYFYTPWSPGIKVMVVTKLIRNYSSVQLWQIHRFNFDWVLFRTDFDASWTLPTVIFWVSLLIPLTTLHINSELLLGMKVPFSSPHCRWVENPPELFEEKSWVQLNDMATESGHFSGLHGAYSLLAVSSLPVFAFVVSLYSPETVWGILVVYFH